MLTKGSSNAPLVMHAGDTIRVHYFVTAAKNGWHINVQDLTTKQSGTIVLNSKSDGPLMPAYNTQQIGKSLKFVGQQSIQLHGGIGMTMEYKVGHYFKRVTAIDTTFGDADHHLGLLAKSDGLVGPLT